MTFKPIVAVAITTISIITVTVTIRYYYYHDQTLLHDIHKSTLPDDSISISILIFKTHILSPLCFL